MVFIAYGQIFGDIKLQILDRKGIPVQQQTLICYGRVPNDGKLVSDYDRFAPSYGHVTDTAFLRRAGKQVLRQNL